VPFLTETGSILETLRGQPGRVRRLWIEQGFERANADIIESAKELGLSFKVIPKEAFLRRFQGARHICLEREEYDFVDSADLVRGVGGSRDALLAAFDGILDPQNLGNVLRTAACLGLDGLIVPKDRSCPVTDAVLRVAKGAADHVRFSRVVNLSRFLDEIKEQAVFCYGLDERAGRPLWEIDLTGRICLVFGSEEGLRRLTRTKCDDIVKVPTRDEFPSLNVATAFALSAYEAVRQRAVKGSR
jgi:23S rRNA (guanosine2251-2'-O)-methyltransferase